MHGNADTRILCSPSERKVELTANTISTAHHSADTNGAAYTNSTDHAKTNGAALVVAYTESAAPLQKKEGNGCIHGECNSPSERMSDWVAYMEM